MTEDEMVGWDHRLNGHEFEQSAEFTGLWAVDRPGVALRPGQGPGAAVSLAQASDKLPFLSSCFPVCKIHV